MNDTHCHCVFPRSTEEELVTLPGATDDTAFRVHVETGLEGYVRLEQLAYNEGLGWYVQKSVVIPGETLSVLLPQLRKADCLIPKRCKQSLRIGGPSLRLTPTEADPGPQTRVG